MDWNTILNWKLLSGSHDFPGPDGGTCINEAAIIAAGFEYRPVASASDCPQCFSPVISTYSIRLNDAMPYDLRQEILMPFVTRLAGTADPANERKRAEYISTQTVRRVLPIAMRAAGLVDHALRCAAVTTLNEAKAAAKAAYAADYSAYAAAAAKAADYAAYAAAKAAADAADAADYAAYAAAKAAAKAAYAADYAAAKREVFTAAVEILDEAIRLGKHGDPLDVALVSKRMGAMKCKQLTACGND